MIREREDLPERTPKLNCWSEGRFKTRKLSASTAQKLERFSYRLAAAHEQSDGYRENSDYEAKSFRARVVDSIGFNPRNP